MNPIFLCLLLISCTAAQQCNCTDIFDKIDITSNQITDTIEVGSHQNNLLYDQTQRDIQDLSAKLIQGFLELNVSVANYTSNTPSQVGLDNTFSDPIISAIGNIVNPVQRNLDSLNTMVIALLILVFIDVAITAILFMVRRDTTTTIVQETESSS